MQRGCQTQKIMFKWLNLLQDSSFLDYLLTLKGWHFDGPSRLDPLQSVTVGNILYTASRQRRKRGTLTLLKIL
jgi:hypothetical protein